MKKAQLFIAVIILFAGTISAQQISKPFFGKIKDKGSPVSLNQRSIMGTRVTQIDSTFFAFRPVTGIGYSFPNNQAMGFAGVSYGNTTYNYETKSTYVNYSFDVVYSLGATTTPEKVQTSASSFGVGVFALNRNVGVLLLWNNQKNVGDPEPAKFKPVVAVSCGINL